MTMIAYAFQHRRLATARREKKNQRAAASANLAGRTQRHPRTLRSTTAAAMPALSKMDLQRAAGVSKSAKVVLARLSKSKAHEHSASLIPSSANSVVIRLVWAVWGGTGRLDAHFGDCERRFHAMVSAHFI